MHEREQNPQDFSFKNYFVPLTISKAIHWIIIIGLAVFANMLFNGFVWDDLGYIVQNPLVHSFNIPLMFGKNFYNIGTQYRPIPVLFFTTEYSLFTTTPFFYHLVELVLHITNAILVFYLFKKFFTITPAFFLSLLFLVHPLQVESVAYIGSSDNPLFFLFGISALFLSFKEVINWKRLLLINFLVFLSLITKETGILFVFLIMGYRILFYKKQKALFAAGFFVTIFIYVLLRASEVGTHYVQSSLSPIAGVSLFGRFITMPAVLFYYLGNFIFPARIAVDQLWIVSTTDFTHFYLPLVIDCAVFFLILLFGITLWHKEKKVIPVFSFFTLWSVIGLGMYSQIIPLDFTVSDRWFYFPVVGLLGLIGVFLAGISLSKKTRDIGVVIGVAFILFLSVRTIIRNTNWVDNMTLFTHDNKIVENYDIENNIGSEYFNRHDYSQALIHYQKSFMLFPYELNTFNVGVTYESLGNIREAKNYYLMVIHRKKFLIDIQYRQLSYEALGKIYTFRDVPTQNSLAFVKNGLKIYPDSGYLWADLAYTDDVFHKYDEALAAAAKAKSLLPVPQTSYIYNQIVNKRKIDFTQL